MTVRFIPFVLLPVAASLAGAQTTQSAPFAAERLPGGVLPARIAIPGDFSGPLPQSAVSGQPYSAEQETESVQTLEDGTHISSGAQKVRLYRDSEGRTRTERTALQPPGVLSTGTAPVFIDVSDPVAGYRYTFDAASQKAYRSSFAPLRIAKPLVNAPAPAGIVAASRAAVFAAPVTGANQALRPDTKTDQLGTQSIEGVLAEGVRTTTTYPAGSIGNDRPVITTNETWMSRELGMPVLMKVSDPRHGVTTTRLFNISRAEPDASLFQPPAGYEIVDPK